MVDKKQMGKSRGGRPRVRSGDEVQVSVEFPRVEYAQLSAFTSFAKEQAAEEGGSVWRQSQRYLFLRLWREFWDSLPLETRRTIERGEPYKQMISAR